MDWNSSFLTDFFYYYKSTEKAILKSAFEKKYFKNDYKQKLVKLSYFDIKSMINQLYEAFGIWLMLITCDDFELKRR